MILPLMLIAAFFIYVSDYYRAVDVDISALKRDYGWFFDGPSTDAALIFYPGAKVDETAYAPLMSAIAGSGLDVCLVKVPFRLAFFGVNKAAGIMGQYAYKH